MRRRRRSIRSPSRSTTQLVAPRGLSTRPTPIGCCSALGSADRGPDRAVEQLVEECERLPELERPLLEPRLHVAGRPLRDDGEEALVGEVRAVGAQVLGEPGRPRAGSDGAEPLGVGGGDDADVGEAILEGGVEEELAPAAERGRVDGGKLFTCSPDLLRVERELAAADADRVEEEAVSAQDARSAGARAR